MIFCCCAKSEAGLGRGILVAAIWPKRSTPDLDRGSPKRTHGNAVSNPRISYVVLRPCLQLCADATPGFILLPKAE